jgi:hypothetical protein
MTARRRNLPVLLTVGGLAAGALGDGLQAWDGPGPVIFAVSALVVALLPRRVTTGAAAVLGAVFVLGALANADDAGLTDPSQPFRLATGVMQLLGYVLAAVAGTAATVVRMPVPVAAARRPR